FVAGYFVDHIPVVLPGVVLPAKPPHRFFTSGGTSFSRGGIADFVRSILREANISFQQEHGAKTANATYLLDNRRLLSEFAIQYRPFRERVLQIINDTRRDVGLPPVGQPP